MSEKIILVRGDDTDFNYQVLLVLNFISTLNLEGYKARLTIENPTNVIKTYEIFNNTCEVNFDKSITSTLEIGEHRCTVKLLNSLNQIKTIYNFDILVQDEFDISTKFINEYTVDIKIDDGINKYKNYNELFNKPLINGVELVGFVIIFVLIPLFLFVFSGRLLLVVFLFSCVIGCFAVFVVL